jgi:hypothetical protein
VKRKAWMNAAIRNIVMPAINELKGTYKNVTRDIIPSL